MRCFSVGKYFRGRSSNKMCSRATNQFVYLFKTKYEDYYNIKCTIKEDKLHYEIRKSFDIFGLDIHDMGDREWFIKNVLDVLFERYDELGYSEGKTFGAGHLHVEWLMNNLVNNIPK